MQPDRSKGKSKGHESSRDTESHDRPPSPRSSPRRLTRRLSMLAVVLSVLAVAIAFLVPGPGAPGSLMAHASRGGYLTIGSACTHYDGAEVAIRVPGPGTIVVSATVGVGINHTFGFNDIARIVVATSGADCTLNNYTAFVSVPRTLSTDPFHFATVPLLRPFPVSGAGSITIYVNGVMDSGADPSPDCRTRCDHFDSASLVAVFYPR